MRSANARGSEDVCDGCRLPPVEPPPLASIDVEDHPLLALPAMPSELARVEAELSDAVESAHPQLTAMAGHLAGAGGKRIRPLFAVAAALCGDAGASPAPVPIEVIRGGVSV